MRDKPQGVQVPTAEADHTIYKSPQRKLVKFFHTSRDQWKGKCRAAKADLKRLKKKLHGAQARQQRWQSRLRALEAELARLHAENRVLEGARAAGEKKDG